MPTNHNYHKQNINIAVYRDKVLGCWTGKNIGGTLGAPFEGQREMNNVTFYTQNLQGKPTPNDDLDLQLIWLLAVEENGLYHINEQTLGEYWLTHITGPWNEYGVCKSNIRAGLYPPLSGSCNNEIWKFSNGAWIRSEIWACLFPGAPDEAARFAYYDSCCDHCGEGIYAEIFTTAMESAAFIVSDVRKVINIGLRRIPADCRVARTVNMVCELYDKNVNFRDARNAVVADNEDLGWFQAPANIGFTIIGLLYGEGDFGKTICIATNCGDDTDCTAGTAGAIMGIIMGRSGIPSNWAEPIGDSIITCSVDTYERNNKLPLPKTLSEFTDRVLNVALIAQHENRNLPGLTDAETTVTKGYVAEILTEIDPVINRIWNRSAYELTFNLPYGRLLVDYNEGPQIAEGEEKKILFRIDDLRYTEAVASLKLLLPDGWKAIPNAERVFAVKSSHTCGMEITFTPGELNSAFYYLPVEVRLSDRINPTHIVIPLQCRGSVEQNTVKLCERFEIESKRLRSTLPDASSIER